MSLKNVHVVFIISAVLLALFCFVDAYGAFRADGSPVMAAAALMCAGVSVLLVAYGARFVRRCREAGIR